MQSAMRPRRGKRLNKVVLAAAAATLAVGAQAQTLRDGAVIGGAAPRAAADAPPASVEPIETERPVEVAFDAVSFERRAVDRVRLNFVGRAFQPASDALRADVVELLAAERVAVAAEAEDAPLLVLSFGGLGYVGGPSAASLLAHVEGLLAPRRTATDSAAANAPWVSTDGLSSTPVERSYALLDGYGGNGRGSEAKLSVFMPLGDEGGGGAPGSTLDLLLIGADGTTLWQGAARGAFGGVSVDFAALRMAELLIDAFGETRRDQTATVMAPLPGFAAAQ